jgi:NADPH-dependent ferric siderophore reductase
MIRPTHKVEVADIRDLSPHIRRITVGGSSLGQFPSGCESGYVKLLFPKEGKEVAPDSIVGGLISGNKPRLRSYTILNFDEVGNELTLDFVMHGDNGPASSWANHAKVGDSLSLRGPGATKLMNHSADWFFISGDLSALPAIEVNLSQLPRDARGYACIEILDEADKRILRAPVGIEISWVINPEPLVTNSMLIDDIRSKPWSTGQVEVWFAGEFDAMRAARKYFKEEKGVPKERIYASSYWKRGETDEGNKRAKRKLGNF